MSPAPQPGAVNSDSPNQLPINQLARMLADQDAATGVLVPVQLKWHGICFSLLQDSQSSDVGHARRPGGSSGFVMSIRNFI